MQQFETFEYSAQGMRDPFTDAWTNPQQGNGGLRPDPNRRKEPLEASRWMRWTWSVPSVPAQVPWRW